MLAITYRNIRLSRFVEKFKNISIENYFNINNINDINSNNDNSNNDNNDKEKIHCHTDLNVNINDNVISFEIHFFKNSHQLYNIFQLPDEINKEIYHFYNSEYLKIKVKIYYSEKFPFKPPKWEFIDLKHNIDIHINLIDYYTEIVSFHNNINNNDWSPAMDIHHDILNFIQKINHFDYMLKRDNFLF